MAYPRVKCQVEVTLERSAGPLQSKENVFEELEKEIYGMEIDVDNSTYTVVRAVMPEHKPGAK